MKRDLKKMTENFKSHFLSLKKETTNEELKKLIDSEKWGAAYKMAWEEFHNIPETTSESVRKKNRFDNILLQLTHALKEKIHTDKKRSTP